jgi:virginiamycin B lyase
VQGPDAALWYTSAVGNAVDRITTGGQTRSYTGGRPPFMLTQPRAGAVTTDPSIMSPSGIAVGPDGALWFTNMNGDSIGRIGADGTISHYTEGYPVRATVTTRS